MEPEELRAEQRWSSIPQHSAPNGYWPKHLDEKLLVLVTNATASGDRFPVGVNWLDISRSIGYSPVECLKRYAFLHNAREQLAGQEPPAERRSPPTSMDREPAQKLVDDPHNPFAGLSSSDDLGSPNSRAFLEYGSPLVSPRLQSLENSAEFGVGSPGSPPPFALRAAYKGDKGIASPLRWESLAKETYSSSPPILHPPPHVLTQQLLRTSFGVVSESDNKGSKLNTLDDVHSPRIIHGTQNHSKFTDPNFAAEIVNHAFKGLRLDGELPPPTATSPRMARAISNSDFPFLSEDDRKNKPTPSLPIRVGGRLGSDVGSFNSRQASAQSTPPMAASPGSQMLASFQGENPFTGSLTQSALEDAFLDMAGSRLDASSMLFASRFASNQSRMMNDQAPPQNQQRDSQTNQPQASTRPQQR